MSVLMPEPAVVTSSPTRAAARRDPEAGAPAGRARPARLTNRAAGRLRDSGDARFGGFGYVRTAQDDAEVAAALARRRPPPSDEQSGPSPASSTTTPPAAAASAGAEPAPTTGPGSEEGPAGAAGTAASAPPSAAAPAAPGTPATGGDVGSLSPPTGVDSPAGLVSAVRTAAGALPTPDVPRASLAQTLRPIVTTARAGVDRERPRGRGGGPPARAVEPIEIDPVPEATKALADAAGKKLPDLRLPALIARPDGVVPRLGTVPGVAAAELAVEEPVTDPAPASEEVNRAERRRRTAASREPEPEPEPTPPRVPLVPPVLVDVRAPPLPPLPAAQVELEATQITRVLAIISQGMPDRARDTVDDIRRAAFPDGDLGRDNFADITDPWVDEVRRLLDEKVGELRAAAGVSEATLNDAVAARRAELEAGRVHRATADELELSRAARDRVDVAEEQNAAALRQERREKARLVRRLRSALHRRDPTLIDELITTRRRFVDDDVAAAVVAADAARTRREELIGRYETAYQDAYRAADADLRRPAGDADARAPPADTTRDGRLWIDVVRDRLTEQMRDVRAETTRAADRLVADIRAAGVSARTRLRNWRDSRLRHTATVEEQAARTAEDATAVDSRITAARTEARRAAVRDDLLRDVRLASAAYLQAQDERNRVCGDRARHLDEQQMAVMRTYLGRGDPGDPMSAVAATLVARVTGEFTSEHTTTFRDEILAKVPGSRAEADDLAMAYFPGGAGGMNGRVSKLWRAFEGPGTDEDAVIEALTGLDGPQTTLLRTAYELRHTETLLGRIDSEMSGSDFTRATGLASADRAMYARGEIDASDGWFSNDSARALNAIRDLPPGSAARVVDDPDTADHLRTVLGGARFVQGRGYVEDERGQAELRLLVMINEGSRPTETSGVPGSPLSPRLRDLQARADAIELDRIIRRGTGSEPPSLDALFQRIRTSVASDPRTASWSAQEIDDEVRRRARAMEIAYEGEFGDELPATGTSALRTAIARYQWGSSRDLTVAMLEVDRAGERAVRLQRTTQGVYTSDSELNSELERTYRDARAEVQRNAGYRRRVATRAEELMDADHIPPGDRTNPRVREAYEREATDVLARQLAESWMTDVTAAFGERYASRWGGDASTALRRMVVSETQFEGEREALDRLRGGGALTEAQAIEHGVAGWGMDRDPVVGSLEGRTTQQIARISAEYQRNTGEDMETRLRSETGGWTDSTADVRLERDAFDIRESLRGVPTTPEQELAAARRRYEYERDVYFRGKPHEREFAVGEELRDLEREFARVQRRGRELREAQAAGDTRSIAILQASIRASHDSMRVSAANYRTAVDAYVDRSTQIVAITAAILAAVAVTVITGGAAGPVVVGLVASLAGTAASIANKQAILGSAYSSTALQTDLIVGAVDAVVTVLTARLGNILLRLPKPTGATQAALRASMKAIDAQRLARPVLHRAAAFAAEQVAQSVPSAVTGALLSRDTWRGDPLRNVLTTAGMAAAVSVGVGTAMHGVTTHGPRVLGAAADSARMLRGGTGAAIAEDVVVLGSARHGLAAGGEAAQRAGGSPGGMLERFLARREYFARFPGATEWDFRLALADGAVRTRQAASEIAALEADMMGHLLSGVSGPERELVGQTRIVMLPDAEFTARTGSDSNGYAATLVLNGDPVVVIREGAPLTRLREEGLHVLQFFDPAHVERLRLLDEARMATWAQRGLGEQIAAWQAKVDLELEVQQRLLDQLRAGLGRGERTPLQTLDLLDHIDEVESALGELARRRDVLSGLGPVDIARMRSGATQPPRFLADEPRLFAKSGGGRRVVLEGEELAALTRPATETEEVTLSGGQTVRRPRSGSRIRMGTVSAEGLDDEFAVTFHRPPAPRAGEPPSMRVATDAEWGELLARYAEAGINPADRNPATAAAWGTAGPRVWDNLFSGDAQNEAVAKLVDDGLIHVAEDGSVRVLEPERYLQWLDTSYQTIAGRPLHPRTRAAVEEYIRSGSLQAWGRDPLTGAGSFAGSLPGTHAEIQAVNDALLSGATERQVAVIRTANQQHFITCLHCTGILGRMRVPPVDVVTGSSVTHLAVAEQWRILAGSAPTAESARLARLVLDARAQPGSLISGDLRWKVPGERLVDSAGSVWVLAPGRSGGFDPGVEALRLYELTEGGRNRVLVDLSHLTPEQAARLREMMDTFAGDPAWDAAMSRVVLAGNPHP